MLALNINKVRIIRCYLFDGNQWFLLSGGLFSERLLSSDLCSGYHACIIYTCTSSIQCVVVVHFAI